jgi:putative transposase
MRGFGPFDAAARFCTAHDELRDHVRYRQPMNEAVSLADQRQIFQERGGEVCTVMQAASQRLTRGHDTLIRARARVCSET